MSTATRRALYGKMAGDTTLTNMLGPAATGYNRAIYLDPAPEHAQFPFIVFSKSSGVPTESFGLPAAMDTEVWLVKAVDQNASADSIEAISERVKTLLNDAVLSVSGGNVLLLRRQADTDYSEVSNGELYRHSGSLYRLIVAP